MIDLRSDTVTQPPAAMLAEMQRATLGDDARDGDETVRKLEQVAAARTGKEAAVLVVSGTMANLVALLTHGAGGGELLCEAHCHTLHYEMGGVSAIAGLLPRGLPGTRGAMDLDALRRNIRGESTRNKLSTALVWLETTHGDSGGAVLPLEHMAAVRAIAQERGVPVHLDGARVFNAAAALGVDVAEVTRHADSVSFCLSKGLSAPLGSLLCGSAEFIQRARGFRKMVGGNLRQAGIVAAAGLYALDHLVTRLVDDHATAQRLAKGLHAVDPGIVDPLCVQTNIVRAAMAASGRSALQWSHELELEGVRANPYGDTDLRLVTHRHIDETHIDEVLDVVGRLWRRRGR